VAEPGTTQNYEDIVRALIAKVRRVPLETVSLDCSLQDLGADSLETLEFVFELEERFNISIPDEGFERSTTVRELVTRLAVLIPPAEA